MENINLLKLNESSYKYYCKNVNVNSLSTLTDARLKMTRNMHLSIIYKTNKKKTWYAYGNLRFMVKDDVVEWIENGHLQHPKWEKDMNKYRELSKKLGIKTTQKIGGD